jgi:hypothetical protein
MGTTDDIAEIASLLDAWAAQRGPLLTVEPPAAMLVGEVQDGWGEWRMLPSRIEASDVERLENDLGVRLPPYYRAFLRCRALIDLDFGAVTLPPLWPRGPAGVDGERDALVHVRELVNQPIGPGYVRFGSARGCGDWLCFDVGSALADGDCPVVVFNHDVVPPAARRERSALERYAGVVAPTFRAFLKTLLSAGFTELPQSPEELRRNEAWSHVRALLAERKLPSHYRPAGVDPTDPWAIAAALRNRA